MSTLLCIVLSLLGSASGRAQRRSTRRRPARCDQNETPFPATIGAGGTQPIGDSLDATSIIAKLRYSLFNGAGFVGVSLRDQSVCRDISSTLSSTTPGAGPTGGDAFANYSGSSIFSHTAAYDFDAQARSGGKRRRAITQRRRSFGTRRRLRIRR